MKKKLAIIGASFDQKPLFLKAKEMGVETHCFAWEKGAICKEFADHFHPISVIEKEQILDICQKIQIDGICTGASEICVPTVCYVAEKMGLTGNNYEDSLIFISKFLMRQTFSKNGVNSPRFTIAEDEVDVTGFNYPLIVKPSICGGVGVTRVEKEAYLKDAIERARKHSFENKAVVEELVTGSEVLAAHCISWKGKHHIISINESESLEASHQKIAYHHPVKLDDKDKVHSEIRKSLDALNIKYGASEVEMIITKDGKVFIIEVNPYMAGESMHLLVKLSTGYDYVKGVINVALNKFEEPVLTVNKYSGMYYLREDTEWVRHIIENKEDPEQEIIEAVFINNDEVYLGSEGYFIYQSDRKRSWKP